MTELLLRKCLAIITFNYMTFFNNDFEQYTLLGMRLKITILEKEKKNTGHINISLVYKLRHRKSIL